jgi:hypothetical protein
MGIGVVLLVVCSTTAMLLPQRLDVVAIDNDAEATRTHSYHKSTIPTGAHGPIVTTRWIEEKWWWQAPSKLIVGDSGRLELHCEATRHEHTLDFVIDEHKTSVITSPITVSVSGPFEWGGALEQIATRTKDKPYEWSWTLTAKDSGEKLIQVALPQEDGQIETKRMFQLPTETNDAESRFIHIPIPVGTAGVISPTIAGILKFAGWILGAGFSAPWLVAIVRRWLPPKKDKPKSKLFIPGKSGTQDST